jgi:PIN like domain
MSSNDRADDKNSESISGHLSGPTDDSGSTNQKRSGIFDNGFDAYRTVTNDDYRSLFASGLIVLDTNVLLDLYRYHPETRQELLNVLNQLRERLWIPNQVMTEFWAGRESVLEDASDITSTVGALDKLGEQYMSRVREWTNRAGLREQTADSLVEISRSAFDATIGKIRSLADDKALKMAEDTAKDSVVIRLESILQGRVGNPLSVERKRAAINKEAPQRFADRRPPGYMDANKKNGNPVGDYLIWIETLVRSRLTISRDGRDLRGALRPDSANSAVG